MNRISRVFLIIITLVVTSFVPPRSGHYTLGSVVIDAGHGGYDPGCLGDKAKEKDIALAVALKLGKYIKDNFKDVNVIYTRKTDVFLELHERTAIANNAKADLFICIHCNSACVYNRKKKKEVCNEEPRGVETWVMGLNKSEANLEVAKRENEVVLLEKDYKKQYDGFDPNSPEANIIFSLYQNTFLDQSLRFASAIENEVRKKGREARGVKQAGFLVLFRTYMPSVLVETGFLSNPAEEKFLMSEKGQDQIAHSIFNAFKSYKNSCESNIPINENDGKMDEGGVEADVEPVVCDTVADVKKVPVKPEPATKKDELNFSVQIVSSPKILSKDSQRFKGLTDIREEKANGVYKYMTGDFSSLNEAIGHQNRMREKGFTDAFVVSFLNGSRITMKEARELLQKK